MIFTTLGQTIQAHQGDPRIYRPQCGGVVLLLVHHRVVTHIGPHGSIFGGPVQIRVTNGQLRWPPLLVGLHHGIGDLRCQKLKHRHIKPRPVGTKGIVEVTGEILARPTVGVGGMNTQVVYRHIGLACHQLGHPALQHQRAGRQVRLYHHQRLAIHRFQIKSPSLESIAKAIGIPCPGGIAHFGNAHRRRNIADPHPRQKLLVGLRGQR